MDYPQNLSKSDKRWYDLIQECRTSGKSDRQWLLENHIGSGTFYYHRDYCAQGAKISVGSDDTLDTRMVINALKKAFLVVYCICCSIVDYILPIVTKNIVEKWNV